MRALEGKVGVMGVERAGQSRRAARRRLRGWREWRRDRRLRDYQLDLAEEEARLPVPDDRQGARREAGPGGQQVQLQLRRPRPEADAAVHAKEAQIAARGPVPAERQVVADVRVHR